MKEKIYTPSAPQAIGPYSQAIKSGKTVYLSGQIALDPKTMAMVTNNFAVEAMQVLNNLKAVAEAAGGNLDAVVKLNIYLLDFNHFPIINDLMPEFFKEPYPARSTVQVSALPKSAQIEIDAVMVIED